MINTDKLKVELLKFLISLLTLLNEGLIHHIIKSINRIIIHFSH